jgi:hypothetical protein
MKTTKRPGEDANQETELPPKRIIGGDSGLDFKESLRRSRGDLAFQPVRAGRPEVTEREVADFGTQPQGGGGRERERERAVLSVMPQMVGGRGVAVGSNKGERRARQDDQLILSAILTLLPELNVESLKVVINSCTELAK